MKFGKLYDEAYKWVLRFGPKIIVAVILFIIGQWLIRMIIKWMHNSFVKREFDPSLKPFLQSLLGTILQVLLVILMMQVVGIPMTMFTTLVGAFAVAAGLALSGTLQNFTGGVLILLLKPYEVGDSIMAQGQEGIVESIQIFYTVVTTFDNKTVIIPNSKLSNEVIINISRQGKRRLDIEMKFNFGQDIEQIKDMVIRSVHTSRDLLQDPPVKIGISSIEADGYKLVINVWVPANRFQDIKLEYQEKLIKDLKLGGIKLPGI